MNRLHPLRYGACGLAFLLSFCISFSSLQAQTRPWADFRLDGVRIEVSGTFNPGSGIHRPSNAGDLSQVAYSVTLHPYRELSIIAIPFGIKPGAEEVPVAEPGATNDYEEALRVFRQSQGGTPQYAPTVNIFGNKVVGISHLVSLNLDGPKPKSVAILEWVVEAGDRMWIVRASQEVADPAEGEKAGDNLADLRVTSDGTLKSRSPLKDSLSYTEIPPVTSDGARGQQPQFAASDLPAPSWWNGFDCDNNHYQAVAGVAAYRLGGVYRGMPACGPRPLAGGTDVVTSFPSGTAQYEWECVELSKRYLYLAYGVNAYTANGSQMVQNYSGSALQKVYNGTSGSAPQAGDVLSYGSTSSSGHTSVVAASSVPGTGTCTNCIQVIEQNNSAGGSAFLSITNWTVSGGPYPVTAWLHYPSSAIPTMPASTSPGTTSSPGPIQASGSVQLSWGASSGTTTYSLGVRDMTTNQLVVDTSTGGTFYTASLSSGRTYRWNVAACNSAGCSAYTTPLYFRTP